MKCRLIPVGVTLLSALVLFGASWGLVGTAQLRREERRAELMALLLPGGAPFTRERLEGPDENITAVYRGTGGFVVETVTEGYGGPITLLTGVEQSGRITGAVVWDMEETWGLGSRALTDPAFLAQAVGRRGELTVGEELDALTGATVTSKALARGLNSAWGYVTGADANTAATEWGG